FFVEGIFLGALGALFPIVVIVVAYRYLVDAVPSFYYFQLVPAHPLLEQMAALLLGVGAFIGVWGSVVSMRRFLRV
ncbi:MAG TPA: cell division protein FtsX, partial [Alicyclobacillus sp.]|nr:cell division protein FtsX [Alicyclobacillus sp.]